MKPFRMNLSSILLACLTVPIIMTYQIFPGDTNYIQFGLIFLLLLSNFFLDAISLPDKKYFLYKYIIFWSVLALCVGGAFVTAIMVRHKVAPVFQIHDIILQLEAAIRFLLDGINPWAATYHNTPLASWHFSDTLENPALYHFVMMPFYLLFSLPFYYISNHTIGYFDGRIPLYILYFAVLLKAFFYTKDREQKMVFTSILALNPAMFAYTLEGRSDFFMFAFFFSSLILLSLKKYSFSGILLALAFAVKQSVWPFLPLYIAYIYFVSGNLKLTLKRLIPFAATFLIVVLPFFAWNPKAFLDSTVFYLSGNTLHSYPISGYGLGMLLHQLGFIKNLSSSYPFVIWQFLIIIPAFILIVRYIKKYPKVEILLFSYGIVLFLYWYLSRYFNNSHVGFLTMIFITAYFWPWRYEDKK